MNSSVGCESGVTWLEQLRELGDYAELKKSLQTDWRTWEPFNHDTVVIRLLAAELYEREGSIEEMREALAPYLENIGRVSFALGARVILASALFKISCKETAEALRLAKKAGALATALGQWQISFEALHEEAMALGAIEESEEASKAFLRAIEGYCEQKRFHRMGLAYFDLGLLFRGKLQLADARTMLERAVKLLKRSRDGFGLATARMSLGEMLFSRHD